MYMFELLSEYHLPEEQIKQHSASFMLIFSNMLKDEDLLVKVAALKAITAFLSSIEDSSLVMQYGSSMEGILDVVVAVLQKDETAG